MTNASSNKRYLFWLTITLLICVFTYLIRGVLLPFVLGATIAYFLDPAADKLEKYGLSRNIATLLITALFFTVIILSALLIIPTLAGQLSGLLADLPNYFNEIEPRYEAKISAWMGALPDDTITNLKTSAANFSGVMIKFAGDFVGNLFQSSMAIVNLFSLILITPVVAFYLLRDWDNVIAKFHKLLPRAHVDSICEQLSIIDRTLAGFIRGQFNVCLILGTYYAIGLSLTGLKFGILIGLMTGFLVILPYVGLIFGMLVGLSVAFFQFSETNQMLLVLGVFIFGQIIEGNFITPKLVGGKVGLHPVWIIFGMLAGASLFGFVGVLIAIPMSAVIGVLIRFAITHYLKSSYYNGSTPTEKIL